MDETGVEENLFRKYGRSICGVKIFADVIGKKVCKTSVIAAYSPQSKTLEAPYVFDGYTDSKRFNGWIEKCLLKILKKGQTVILDNAPFHKNKLTQELIKSAGCKVLFLPPYSPDFNPIEKQWAILKAKFRKHKHKFQNFDDAINYAFIA